MDPDITTALEQLSKGDQAAMTHLLPQVYAQLRAIARREMARERPDHTLTPTALVHEAYLKLVQLDRSDLAGPGPFLRGPAPSPRARLLISHARRRNAGKRRGAARDITIDNAVVAMEPGPPN